MREVVIVDAVRTPVGRRNGGLSTMHSADLLAVPFKALFDRTGMDPAEVGQVHAGAVEQCLERHRQQVGRVHGGQAPVAAPHWGANGIDDHDFTHGSTLCRWAWRGRVDRPDTPDRPESLRRRWRAAVLRLPRAWTGAPHGGPRGPVRCRPWPDRGWRDRASIRPGLPGAGADGWAGQG